MPTVREQAMRLIRNRVDVLSENEYYISMLCILADGRAAIISANKHTGEASCTTPVTGEPFIHAKPR
jgi:hypothetical protein